MVPFIPKELCRHATQTLICHRYWATGHFFTWIAPGNVHLHSSLILASKTYAVEEGTSAACLYHKHIKSTHATDGMTVVSLPAAHNPRQVQPQIVCAKSLRQKIIVYCMHLIVFNQIWSCEFKQWCKFSSCVKAKAREKKSHKTRPAHTAFLATLHSNWLTYAPVLCKDKMTEASILSTLLKNANTNLLLAHFCKVKCFCTLQTKR